MIIFLLKDDLHGDDRVLYTKDHDIQWKYISSLNLSIYSAFYDNRTSLGTWPSIKIIVMAKAKEINKLPPFCHIHFTLGRNLTVQSIPMELSTTQNYFDRGFYKSYIINCPIGSYKIPVNVGLSTAVDIKPNYYQKILLPESPDIKQVDTDDDN
ncbi:DgyrCDS1398 [Dimorphilus gyrociliatus]|uniref:DgyrCDS1398 n=1 Tax=Dimorphilus gyrociliatus TaxID=2664684 RepID=A0A7I8VA29_9ANNE|nr:DgyrCDS1398 [Dimorphilus gyrociliatus]